VPLLAERLSPLDILDLVLAAFDARLRPQVPVVAGERRAQMPRVITGGMVVAAGVVFVAVISRAEPGPFELGERRGTLAKDGAHYLIDGQVVDAGPDWYITHAMASADYDGDGGSETIAAELDGLVGMTVSLGVENEPGDKSNLFTINGQFYRTTDGGRPPWAGGPDVNRPLN